MIIGIVFMKSVPHSVPTSTSLRPSFDDPRGGRQSSQTPLLRDTYGHDAEADSNVGSEQIDEVMAAHDVEMSPNRGASSRHHGWNERLRKGAAQQSHEPLRNVHGIEMFRVAEFWILFVIISLRKLENSPVDNLEADRSITNSERDWPYVCVIYANS